MPTNVERVQKLYEAFGQGNIQAILDGMAPDVTWSIDGPASLPFFGDRHGREQVAQFFHHVTTKLEIHEFTPREFVAQGEHVVVLGYERGKVVSTGRSYEGHWAHVFTLRLGQVAAFREYSNTAAFAEAFHGAARTAA